MARDTFLTIAQEARDITGYDIEVCRIAARDSFRELLEKYNWTWLYRRGALIIPAPYSTGTVAVVEGYDSITFTGATLTQAMVGMQFRCSTSDPFYTINSIDTVAGTAVLDQSWAGVTNATSAYTISQVYITPPDDFFSWISVKDLEHSYRLNLNIDQSLLDVQDARRSSTGTPVLLSPVDYSRSYQGKVAAVMQIVGAGPKPVSGGSYTGSADAIYTIQITAGGLPDTTSTFKYRKNEQAFSANLAIASAGTALDSGVGLAWSAASNFIVNDIFLVRCTSISSPGIMRYELYPSPTTRMTLPIYYMTRYPDISDPGITIPRFIPGNVIKTGTLAKLARIPGAGQKPNPFAQVARAQAFEMQFETQCWELVRNDNEVAAMDVGIDLGYAPLPWGFDIYNQQPLTYDPPWIYPGYH